MPLFHRFSVLPIFVGGLSGCNIASRSKGNNAPSNLATSSLWILWNNFEKRCRWKAFASKITIKNKSCVEYRGRRIRKPCLQQILHFAGFPAKRRAPQAKQSLKKKQKCNYEFYGLQKTSWKIHMLRNRWSRRVITASFQSVQVSGFRRSFNRTENNCSFVGKWLRKKRR